jgi:curved DNA-binding protein CbpA
MARQIRLVQGVDYKKLPLTPVEGNVYSRIDGKATDEDIIRLTGFHPDTVAKALERLVQLGAAEILDKAKLEKEQTEKGTKVAAQLAFGGALGKVGEFDRKLLDEEVDLDVEKKKQILDAFGRLEKITFYELLGLHQLVDRKEVKAAYYAIAPEFHPDKFFKRKLGSYKSKIEAIFARLTLAHDTLTSKQKRAEYDEYVKTFEQNRKASEILSQAQGAIHAAQAAIEQQARAAAAGGQEDPRRQQDLAERKRALAAKLGGARFRQQNAAAKVEERSSAPPPMDPKAAAEALRVRYEYAKQEALRTQIDHYVASGRRAIAGAEWAAAANYFKIAASIAPNDDNVQREANEVMSLAATALAENFARQGEFELHQERYMEAAVSFSKAAQGKPEDARLHERAAFATFRSGNNPRRAVELARRAVELAPKQSQMRITLAYCFMSAGFESSANAELDRALEISGKDDKVHALVTAARDAIKQFMVQLHQQEKAAQQAAAERASGQHPAVAGPASVRQPSGQMPAQHVPPPSPSQSGYAHQAHPSAHAGYAQPHHTPVPSGHPQAGYPQQGYAQQGYAQQGHPQQGHPQQGHPQQHQQQGYPQQGYPQQGHPQQYQQQGYSPSAYPQGAPSVPPQQAPSQQGYAQPSPYPQAPPAGQAYHPSAYPHASQPPQQGYNQPSGYPAQGYGQHGYSQPPQAPTYPPQGYTAAPSGYPSVPAPRASQPSIPPQINYVPADLTPIVPPVDPAAHTRPTPPQGVPQIPPEATGHPNAASPRMSGAYSVVNPAAADRRQKR